MLLEGRPAQVQLLTAAAWSCRAENIVAMFVMMSRDRLDVSALLEFDLVCMSTGLRVTSHGVEKKPHPASDPESFKHPAGPHGVLMEFSRDAPNLDVTHVPSAT